MTHSAIAPSALGALAVLAACARDAAAPAVSPAVAPSAAHSAAVAPAPKDAKVGRDVGELAPDFEAKAVDGTSFKLSDYRGKVVVLDFWGFW